MSDANAINESFESMGSGHIAPCSPLPPDDSTGSLKKGSHINGISSPYIVIVSIDFGTAYSGYAFTFTRDPNSIHMMKKWEGGDPGVTNQKIPTTLLMTPSEQFHSFGFAARDYYHDLELNYAKTWLFFERFKMALYANKDMSRKTQLKAANGKSVSAIKVFSWSLKFFKEHAMKELCEQSATDIHNEDIRWVITVPAIWHDSAKQFMRECGYEAGLASPKNPDQLLIALEPEAASICCRRLQQQDLIPDEPPSRNSLLVTRDRNSIISNYDAMQNSPPAVDIHDGTRYMVVDCGGGTIDITVHEMDTFNGTLTELHKATGGSFGSISIDAAFEELLKDIFGKDFIELYKIKRPAGWVDFMIAFEARKRNASPFKQTPLNISIPFSFIDYHRKTKSTTVETSVRKYGDKDVKWSSQGMLRLTPEGMKRLFRPTLDNVVHLIRRILNKPEVGKLQYLFLVGGFAESPILQQEVRNHFMDNIQIIIPQGVGLVILKGSVLFGLDPTIVRIRRPLLTYGIGVLNKFNPSKHPEVKKVTKDGVDWCVDVFDVFVREGQPIALGEAITRCYTPAKVHQKSSVISVYSSERPGVLFVTDAGVRKCGALNLDLSDFPLDEDLGRREIRTTMQFGNTEIKLSALDVKSGRCIRSSVDFMNR